jgi:hypothetical protein
VISSSSNKSVSSSERIKKEDIDLKLAIELPEKWWARIPAA